MKSMIKENKPHKTSFVVGMIFATIVFYFGIRLVDKNVSSPLLTLLLYFFVLFLAQVVCMLVYIFVEWIIHKILKARGKL